MKKQKEKNTRITEATIETARTIFKSSERLGIIFLLTKTKMSIEEIEEITGDSGSLILHHLVELEKAWIIKREFQVLKKTGADDRMFFKINEDIQDELVQIINSFLRIQDILEKYKKLKEKEKI